MFLFIEVVLTIFAWRNGWRWKALLPLGIGLVLGSYLAVIVAFSGGTTDTTWTIVFDIAASIVLIIMCDKKPKTILNK
jgi:hypothetical protein